MISEIRLCFTKWNENVVTGLDAKGEPMAPGQ